MGIEQKNNDLKLESYLPSISKLEEMDKYSFEAWVHRAADELAERAQKRDPLFQLKKRISVVLTNPDTTEVQKEQRVLSEIEVYKRITSQFQK